MGKQSNKVENRRRRKSYIKRKKTAAKMKKAAASKKVLSATLSRNQRPSVGWPFLFLGKFFDFFKT
jgi:hypothetical protein